MYMCIANYFLRHVKFGAIVKLTIRCFLTIRQWRHIKDLLHIFCQASGMKFSDNKSMLMSLGGDDALVRDIFVMLNF